MSNSLTSTSEPDFVCECGDYRLSVCAGEPFYEEHEGIRYCVLHFPGSAKGTEFDEALQRKLQREDYNFCGVWFPWGAQFSEVKFGAQTDFRNTTFEYGAFFRKASFDGAGAFP